MLQYWTTWNFIWYTGFKLQLYKLNTPLKTSIIATSIVGGFLVYIYPRRMKVKIGNNEFYRPPFYILMAGDLFLHQYPYIDILTKNYDYNKMCILYTYLPLFVWYNVSNKIVDGKMDKLYGVPIKNVLFLCTSVASIFGVYHHLIKK